MEIQYLLNPSQDSTPAVAYPVNPHPQDYRTGRTSQPEPKAHLHTTSRAVRKRPGIQAKGIAERPPTCGSYGQPRRQIQRSYTREFKLMVLSWWAHAQVPDSTKSQVCDETVKDPPLRTPLLREVSERYLVPITTLHDWKCRESQIVAGKRGERRSVGGSQRCRWPRVEEILYEKYKERRDERKAVRRNWLIRKAKETFVLCYPDQEEDLFTGFNGWFSGFLSRHDITLRFTTNKSQKVPHDYLDGILSWFRFNRRNSLPRPGTMDELKVVGRYLLDSIANVDETPLPFEYLNGQTYADKGSRSVQVKATSSGWDKRQATLVLAVFGSGKPLVRPLIIFRGKERYDSP